MTQGSAFSQQSDQVGRELFKEIETTLRKVKQEDVWKYAPSLFARAAQHCARASRHYEKGEFLQRIRKELGQVTRTLAKAFETTKVSKMALSGIEEVHRQAIEAKFIREMAPKEFARGEQHYKEAIARAEAGDIRARVLQQTGGSQRKLPKFYKSNPNINRLMKQLKIEI